MTFRRELPPGYPHTEHGWGERWVPPTDAEWGNLAQQMPRDAGKLAKQTFNDEVRWGAKKTFQVDITAAGNFASATLEQMISADRPPRAWQIQLAIAFNNGARPINPPNDFLVFFVVENGVGSSKTQHYVQLTNADLVVWAFPDDALVPVASTTLELPAQTLIISSRVLWVSDGSENGKRTITAYAMVAPVVRQ